MLKRLILDNPILVKYTRTRLRRQHLLPLIAIVLVISIALCWGVFIPDHSSGAYAGFAAQMRRLSFTLLLLMQGIILLLLGSWQVAGAVAQARATGMMDFYRVSPQRSFSLAVGFLLGAPIREYVLFACTVPFSFIMLASHQVSLSGLLAILIDLLVVALLYHAAALLVGLMVPKPMGVSALMAVLILAMHLLWGLPAAAYTTILPTYATSLTGTQLINLPYTFSFLGTHLPAFALSLIHQVTMFVFLLVGATRKVRHERAFVYNKPTAVLFFAVLAMLIIGDAVPTLESFTYFDHGLVVLSVVYGLLVTGFFLLSAITPCAGEFAKGYRQARKLRRRRVNAWSDYAVNLAPLLCMGVIMLGAGWLGASLAGYSDYALLDVFVPVLVGVCALFTYGFARQSFNLQLQKNGSAYFLLFLFFVWVVPLILGTVFVFMGQTAERSGLAVLSISPIAGIGMSFDKSFSSLATIRATALISNVLLTFIMAVIYANTIPRAAADLAARQDADKTRARVG